MDTKLPRTPFRKSNWGIQFICRFSVITSISQPPSTSLLLLLNVFYAWFLTTLSFLLILMFFCFFLSQFPSTYTHFAFTSHKHTASSFINLSIKKIIHITTSCVCAAAGAAESRRYPGWTSATNCSIDLRRFRKRPEQTTLLWSFRARSRQSQRLPNFRHILCVARVDWLQSSPELVFGRSWNGFTHSLVSKFDEKNPHCTSLKLHLLGLSKHTRTHTWDTKCLFFETCLRAGLMTHLKCTHDCTH